MPPPNHSERSADVVIGGAELAALWAARWLSFGGYSRLVLEVREHVGDRRSAE